MDDIQKQINSLGSNEDLMEQEALAQIELQQALLYEEEFWREKTRINWHCQGDRNAAYFHRNTKIRYASKSMSMLKHGDAMIDDPEDIAQHVLSYFSSFMLFQMTAKKMIS